MKKTTAFVLLVIAALIFLTSAVDDLTKFFSDNRKTPTALKSWWGSDKYQYGDLYGMTYLPQFRNADPAAKDELVKDWDCGEVKSEINIYALSDSYTWDIFKDPANFCNAGKSGFAASNFHNVLPVKFDSTKKNIIVIESTERNVRTMLADTAYLVRFISLLKGNANNGNLKTDEERRKFHFNFRLKNNEANYEFNIWDYRFLTPLKELKAKVTFDWFKRTSPDATVSDDGKFLLLKSTVDTAFLESSFKPVSESEIKKIVTGLNKVYDHYKQLGFDEIYLAIIPNPVTILYPEYKNFKYNQLIPRIQNNPGLKLTVFDSYRLFKNSPEKEKLYKHSDTHWTAFGKQLWLRQFNYFLIEHAKQQ